MEQRTFVWRKATEDDVGKVARFRGSVLPFVKLPDEGWHYGYVWHVFLDEPPVFKCSQSSGGEAYLFFECEVQES